VLAATAAARVRLSVGGRARRGGDGSLGGHAGEREELVRVLGGFVGDLLASPLSPVVVERGVGKARMSCPTFGREVPEQSRIVVSIFLI
jgi:hypothetical protein